jgi:hypothetical protein
MGTKSVTVFVATILGGLLWFFFKETALAIAIETALAEFFDHMGWERGKMIVAAAPFIAMIGIGYALAFISYRLGETEKIKEPVIDIDPRLAFKNIIKNKRWLRKYTETDPEKLQHKVSNYLDVRLDRQFHEFLVAGKLAARGEIDLNPGTGPMDWIPKKEWRRVEIIFDEPDNRLRCRAKIREGGSIEYYGIKLSSRQIAKCFRIRRRNLFK